MPAIFLTEKLNINTINYNLNYNFMNRFVKMKLFF
jgi:hypothetical protein